jgi:hypothetical protein
MRRKLFIALLVCALAPAAAHAATVGVEAFGGLSIPILQDDNGQGSTFGARVPVALNGKLTIEPFFSSSSGGDKDVDINSITYTRSGIDVTSFGASLLVTFGGFYPYAGIGSYALERSAMDYTKVGYSFGLGYHIPIGVQKLAVDLRGGVVMVVEDTSSSTARKWGDITVGLSYNLFQFGGSK